MRHDIESMLEDFGHGIIIGLGRWFGFRVIPAIASRCLTRMRTARARISVK